MKLLGNGLRQRRADVLPDLRLSGEDGDRAVSVDVQPRVHIVRQLFAPAASASGFLRFAAGRHEQHEQPGAGAPQEIAAIEIEAVARAFEQFVPFELDGHRASLRWFLCGLTDRGDDARIGAAATEMPIHGLHDGGVARRRVGPEQRHGSHDHAGRTVTALHRVVIEERLLHAIELPVRAETLDGLDAMTGERGGARRARANRFAIDEDRARAALALAAAVLRAGQIERFAQHPEQAAIRIDVDGAS